MRATAIGIAGVVILMLSFGVLRWQSRDHILVAGFWFEDLTYDVDGFTPEAWGGVITLDERRVIESTARAELAAAFAGLRVRVTDDRQARFRVCVVQRLMPPQFPGFRRGFAPAGESRSISGLGGRGAVNFGLLATYAISYAPLPWHRATIVEAIGRGIGRAAVHEFAHQFFPAVAIDSGADAASYEYHSASRPQQYYGPIHWSHAWPRLVRRFGPIDTARAGVNRSP